MHARMLKIVQTELLRVFDSAVSSVMPATLIEEKVKLVNDQLFINDKPYAITENVYMIGFGKAVAGMAYALEKVLGKKLKRGIISVPTIPLKIDQVTVEGFDGLKERRELHLQNLQMLKRSKIIEYCEGAENNQPDEAALVNTNKIIELAEILGENDTLLTLISGGGSALLFSPRQPLTGTRKRDICKQLQNAGASIIELNCVRQHLSSVKGGGLAEIAYPAKVLALVLSDIVGDPLEFIASGPTCVVAADYSSKAVAILKKYHLYDNLDEDIKLLLSDDRSKQLEDKNIIENGKFKHVENIIIGNNNTALLAAQKAAKALDMECIILTSKVEGNVEDVSYAYAKFAKIICFALENKFSSTEIFISEILKQNIEILNINQQKLEETFKVLVNLRKGKGILLLCGGEPTVVVKGNGKGGRNQELALRFSLNWLNEISKNSILSKYFTLFLSAGTDGQDGPTDAAGAFSHPSFRPKLIKNQKNLLEKRKLTLIPKEIQDLEDKLKLIEGTLPESVLERNDSYQFFSRFENGQYLVKTSLTGTNVMDLHFIYIKRKDCECDIQHLSKNNEFNESCNFLFDFT